MKKLFAMVFALLCLCLCLSACEERTEADNKLYRIEKIGGRYYLYFEEEENWREKDREEPEFSSFAEMREAILSGKLPDAYVRWLRAYEFDWNEGDSGHIVLPLYDLQRLYDIVLPSNVELDSVTWYGTDWYYMCNIDGQYMGIRICNEEQYNYYRYESIDFYREESSIVRIEEVEDRNATVIYTDNGTYKGKEIQYEITQGDLELYIGETYYLEFLGEEEYVSSERPYTICFVGKQKGMYIRGIIFADSCLERPSEEWWRSFAIKVYHGTT